MADERDGLEAPFGELLGKVIVDRLGAHARLDLGDGVVMRLDELAPGLRLVLGRRADDRRAAAVAVVVILRAHHVHADDVALFEHLVGGLAVEQAAAHAGADHRHGHLVALGDLGEAVGDEAVNVLFGHAGAGAGKGAVNDLFDVGAEGDDAVKFELHLDEAHLFVRGVGVDDLGVRQLPVHEIHIDGGEIGELHTDALRLHAELLELVDGDHHRVLGELVVADDALLIHPALGAHDGLFNVHNDDDGVILLGDDVDDLAAADRDLRGDVSAGDVGDVLRCHGDHGVQMVLFQHFALKIGDLFHGDSSVFCF